MAVKTFFERMIADPIWRASKGNEARAQVVGDNKGLLKSCLMEARGCLIQQYRSMPVTRYDFNEKRLYLGSSFYLQWQLRDDPNKPESYENQQTNSGAVILCEILTAEEAQKRAKLARVYAQLDALFDLAESGII